jgi:hypothetical protein
VGAFLGCQSLSSIVFPSSVSRIGLAAFGICFSLQSIEFLGDAPTLEGFPFVSVPLSTPVKVRHFSNGFGPTLDSLTVERSPHLEFDGDSFFFESNTSSFEDLTLYHSNDLINWAVVEDAVQNRWTFRIPSNSRRLDGINVFFRVGISQP